MKIRALLAIILLSFSGASVNASGPEFNEVLTTLLNNDPAVRAQLLRNRAELKALHAAGAPEALDLDFDYKWGHGQAPRKWGISVSQSFDWPGVYSSRRKALRASAIALDASQEAYVRSRRIELAARLADYVALSRRCSLLEDFAANTSELLRKYERLYEAGEVIIVDLRRLRIEDALAQGRVAQARAERSAVRETIELLNGEPLPGLSSLMEYPDLKLGDIDAESYPEVIAARYQVEAGELAAQTAARTQLPGFSLGFLHEKEGSENFTGFSVGLSLNLWKSGAETAAARLAAYAAQETAEATLRERRAELAARTSNLASIQEAIIPLERSIGDPQEYISYLDRLLTAGSITLFQYLTDSNAMLEAQMELETLRATAAQQAIALQP